MTRCTDIRSKPSSTSTTVASAALALFVLWKHLLAAKLRPANVDPAEGALEELHGDKPNPHSVAKKHGLVRGDSAYSREDIMAWCESQGIDYVFGLASNARLMHESRHPGKAKVEYQQLKESVTWYRSLWYKTLDSWSQFRRGRQGGLWTRGLPTPLLSLPPPSTAGSSQSALHSALLSWRDGEPSEQQLELFSARTSSIPSRGISGCGFLHRLCC